MNDLIGKRVCKILLKSFPVFKTDTPYKKIWIIRRVTDSREYFTVGFHHNRNTCCITKAFMDHLLKIDIYIELKVFIVFW